ncbi:MAG: VWA domain-containing protein [Lachnospiraceae bacterium]|nr:VWA domain-containing protein [Lachnospiraceae bacterium]
MGSNKSKGIIGCSLVVVFFIVMIVMLVSKLIGGDSGEGSSGASLDKLIKYVDYDEKEVVKGSVDLSDASLYDELPDISKYPLTLEDKSGEIQIEIFSSPEKAGTGTDSWLIDMAESFNAKKEEIDGRVISVSIRNISSGLAADYIISGKYVPTGFSPSSALWGAYVDVQGAKLDMVEECMVGNVAGFLVSKKAGYKDYKEVIEAVQSGKINIGYTNPQVSTTGMNLLVTILSVYGNGDLTSGDAVKAFSDFQRNIPYVATNTIQMRDSSANGSLDGMTLEYQSYIQDKELQSTYDFVPFGVRHDNPMYACQGISTEQRQALEKFTQFCTDAAGKKEAEKKGFYNNMDYTSDIEIVGKDVKDALDIYKREKDSGQAIIAVFVADVSGSMSGEPLNQLKESLQNGMKYINDTNYVGLVSYSSDVSIEVPIAQFDLNQKAYFQGALNRMSAGGNTASYDALVVAMKMIEDAKADHPDAKTMLFLLSDGQQNEGYSLNKITAALEKQKTPVYTICYGEEADTEEMAKVSSVNEAASIVADPEDIVYKIKSLFNSSL